MSEQAARELVQRMKTDQGFRERVLAAGSAADRLSLITAEGYEVTAEEIESHAARLDDASLTHVVGGTNGAVARPSQDAGSEIIVC